MNLIVYKLFLCVRDSGVGLYQSHLSISLNSADLQSPPPVSARVDVAESLDGAASLETSGDEAPKRKTLSVFAKLKKSSLRNQDSGFNDSSTVGKIEFKLNLDRVHDVRAALLPFQLDSSHSLRQLPSSNDESNPEFCTRVSLFFSPFSLSALKTGRMSLCRLLPPFHDLQHGGTKPANESVAQAQAQSQFMQSNAMQRSVGYSTINVRQPRITPEFGLRQQQQPPYLFASIVDLQLTQVSCRPL